MNAQEKLDAALKTAHEEINDVCLIAALTLPDSPAITWGAATKFYEQFFMVAGFITQSNPTMIVGGIGDSYYEIACETVAELRKMPNVTILLDPTDRCV